MIIQLTKAFSYSLNICIISALILLKSCSIILKMQFRFLLSDTFLDTCVLGECADDLGFCVFCFHPAKTKLWGQRRQPDGCVTSASLCRKPTKSCMPHHVQFAKLLNFCQFSTLCLKRSIALFQSEHFVSTSWKLPLDYSCTKGAESLQKDRQQSLTLEIRACPVMTCLLLFVVGTLIK